MNANLKQVSELFVYNKNEVRKYFVWNSSYMYPLISLMYSTKLQTVDVMRLKECKKIIKRESSIFSGFHGLALLSWAARLSLLENPEQSMVEIKRIYKMVREEFRASEYLVTTAFQLYEYCSKEDYARVIKKAKELYQELKKAHPFLTGKEDVSYIMLFAMKMDSVKSEATEIEHCYQELKFRFSGTNGVQALSYVLAFDRENYRIKTNKAIMLYERLAQRGYQIGKRYELAALGVAAFTKESVEVLVDQIVEVYDYLHHSKGLGNLFMTKKSRIMYATLLVCNQYVVPESNRMIYMGSDVTESTALMIAEQIAISAATADAAGSCRSVS